MATYVGGYSELWHRKGAGDFGKYIKHGRKRTIINNGSTENRRVDGGMIGWLGGWLLSRRYPTKTIERRQTMRSYGNNVTF